MNFIWRLNKPDDGDRGYCSSFEAGLDYTSMVLKSLGNLMSFNTLINSGSVYADPSLLLKWSIKVISKSPLLPMYSASQNP